MGVEPDQHQADGHGQGKRHVPGVEDKLLQHDGHQVEPEAGANHPRHQKNHGSRFIAPVPQPALQIPVNRNEVQAVVKRQQHRGDEDEAHRIAQHKLEIPEAGVDDRPRHGDKGDPGEGRADHAEGHEIPFGVAVGDKEAGVVGGAPGGEVRNAHQHREITDQKGQKDEWRHAFGAVSL